MLVCCWISKGVAINIFLISHKKHSLKEDFFMIQDIFKNIFGLDLGSCPPLSASNGQVTHNSDQENGRYSVSVKATYSCNDGYFRASGWRVRTCQSSGRWSGWPTICKQSNEKWKVYY